MAPSRKRNQSLSNVDVAWYQMEVPTNLMMITGLLVFDEPVDFDRLRHLLETQLVGQYRRFRQRVVQRRSRFGRPYWQDDPNFDITSHLHRVGLPAPGDHEALEKLVSDLMSTPLDFGKPLWQFHLVDGYEDQSVLLVRLHHCIGDGIALMQVVMSLTTTERDAAPQPAPRAPRRRSGWNPLAPVTRPARAAVDLSTRALGATIEASLQIARNPEHLIDIARTATDLTLTTGRLLLMSADARTPYKGKLGVPKRAAWSRPIPLEEIKLIGQVTDATVNDVLMSAAAGAMRRYLVNRDAPVADLDVRAIIPVNLRPPGAPLTLGNRFGLVFLSLPLGIQDPIQRLRELKRRMDALKTTTEPIVAFGILNLIGMMPDRLEDRVIDIFGAKGTVVMTNVPGPRQKMYFAGAGVDQMMFWVPQSGRLGIGVSILSYNGKVMIGVATDAGLIADPEAVVAGFHAELEALKVDIKGKVVKTALQLDLPRALAEAELAGGAAIDIVASETPSAPGVDGVTDGKIVWQSPEDGDNLTRISGIGPAFAERLHESGITSFAVLAAATPDALQAIIDAPDWRRPDYQDWIDQARAIAS
jgi:WS/DGAT/MGAT family acyltransferase